MLDTTAELVVGIVLVAAVLSAAIVLTMWVRRRKHSRGRRWTVLVSWKYDGPEYIERDDDGSPGTPTPPDITS